MPGRHLIVALQYSTGQDSNRATSKPNRQPTMCFT